MRYCYQYHLILQKMGSKIFLLSGLLLAFVLLISSDVAARDLVETSTVNRNDEVVTEKDVLNYAKYIENPPIYPNPPVTYGGLPNPGGPRTYGPGGSGNSCPKGCCGGGYKGRGCTCC